MKKKSRPFLDKLPEAKSISSLPGVGERLAPELTAALGPKSSDSGNRFQSAEEIMKLSGCAPVTRQSGKWKTVSFRYACVKSLRRTFRDWAFASLDNPSGLEPIMIFTKPSICPIQPSYGISAKNGPEFFFPYGPVESFMTNSCTFRS